MEANLKKFKLKNKNTNCKHKLILWKDKLEEIKIENISKT